MPVAIYVPKYTGWNEMYAYVFYEGDTHEADWPGTKITEDFQSVAVSAANVGKKAHVILNAGNANLAKVFTRIETAEFTASTSKLVTVSTVSQANLKLYFRDDKGQNENWGDYKIYGWYNDDSKIFGDWHGTSKSSSIFTWKEWSDYGQKNNYIAEYTFTGKPAINLIINDGGSNQTADINLAADKDNWFVVSNGCTGTAQTESFPTVSVSVQ
jgi:hypothetical protein